MDENDVKPVEEWDMNFPQEISALKKKYETSQVELCGLSSNTVR